MVNRLYAKSLVVFMLSHIQTQNHILKETLTHERKVKSIFAHAFKKHC